MKLSKTIMMVFALVSASALALSCAPRQAASTTQTQVVTVERGDLSVDITAAGNLALADKEELAFEIPGTVEEVLVNEGNSVTEGQVLARLDTSEWDKQLKTLERQVTTAERQVTTAQKQLRDKQTAVTTAQNAVTTKEFSLRQAQLDLQSAQDAVMQIKEVKRIQDQIDLFENELRFMSAEARIIENSTNATRQLIDQYKKEMQAILAGTSTTVSNNVALDISKKQLAVEKAQFEITVKQLEMDNAKVALEDSKNAIAPTEQDLQNSQDDLQTAKDNLADAKSYSPEVIAPFDGFVTKVNVKGGDDVKKGTIAVIIADPTKFEADVLVSENDISKVKLGALASIELQSATGVTYAANITHIAPTATVQQGVVNYKVTVELQSLRPVAQVSASGSPAAGNTPGGFLFGRGGSANLTQEQIAQLRQQAQSGQFARPGAFGGANLTQEQRNQLLQQRQPISGGSSLTQEQIAQLRQQMAAGADGSQAQIFGGQSSRLSQTAAVAASEVRLAEGMSVTVTIPVDSRTNVQFVPNGAITTRSGQSTVKVNLADGQTEDRAIQTGISNYQYTEIVSGLSEGEQVVITRSTSTTSTSRNQPTNTIRMPAGGAIFGR